MSSDAVPAPEPPFPGTSPAPELPFPGAVPAPELPFPGVGRLLGIDFGSKRIGVSVSDVDQRMAVPVEIVQRQDAVQVMRRFKMLAIENRAKGLVVGLPVFTSGDEGGGALAARRFGTELAAALQLPVRFWDERYSSSQADELLRDMDLTNKKRKARRDMLAAQIILQSYLDSDDRTGQPKPLHDR